MRVAGARRGFAAAWLAAALAAGAQAETATSSGGGATTPRTATARLDFILNIGRFIFFRVGPRAYPVASANPASVAITLQPTIPGVPTTPLATGDNLPTSWSGAAPSFAATPDSVPVQVYSNAGQISIRADVVSALVSGANSIPLSEIVVTSTDAGLPAPPIPDAGTGASVSVGGTAFGNLVTIRSADWNFGYTPAVLPPPGIYSGQISFTAVSP